MTVASGITHNVTLERSKCPVNATVASYRTLFAPNAQTLFMSPDVKQLPKNLLSNCALLGRRSWKTGPWPLATLVHALGHLGPPICGPGRENSREKARFKPLALHFFWGGTWPEALLGKSFSFWYSSGIWIFSVDSGAVVTYCILL